MTQIQIKGLSKEYIPGKKVLSEVVLTISKGERIGIMGPSGSGKSTLLRIIAGLEKPTSGSIYINGRNIRSLEPCDRNVALTMQRPVLYPYLNIRDNLLVSLNLAQKRLKRTDRLNRKIIDNRVSEVAALLRVQELLERYPSQLSGGEQCRVALGRVVMRQPMIWLLDEPFSQIEPDLKIRLWEDLKGILNSISATILYVSHDPSELNSLTDRVVLIRDGAIAPISPNRR